MTTDITELAQSMKAAAEKATPGEWVYFPKNTSIEYDVGSDESQGSILYVDSGDFTQAQTDRNGEFIALANPANILALVEALEAQGTEIEWMRKRIAGLGKELEVSEERRVKWFQMAQALGKNLDGTERRIAELESRTVTVKLPPRVDTSNVPFAALTWNCCLDEIEKRLTAAGIKWEAE
ncbi:ead/Ea22-like family protein [Klebsiella oxytoca]